jgi:Tol biopolymer transport system component
MIPFNPRRRRWFATAAGVALLLTGPALVAQQDARGGRGAAGLPLTPTRTVAFETSEGTWMSLDVSPDGSKIVFDLLGDIYTLPIAGGTATRITSGPAMDAQPKFSPDGRQIAYVSDAGGADNLWVMSADGRNSRALTRGDYGHYISPVWTPDGEYIMVSRGVFQNVAFTDTYDVYMYDVAGGTGLRVLGGAAPAAAGRGGRGGGGSQNYLGAAFGKDPRYMYVSRKAGGWGYNLQFPGWQVVVFDRRSGKSAVKTSAFGSGMRPALSPDGKWLVYATRIDTTTVLRIRDLASGDESTLLSHVQRDDQESRFTRDLMPGYAFTPDSKAIVLSHDGGFWRAEVPSGKETPIPFTAHVEQQLGPLVKFDVAVNDSLLAVQQIRDARPSADGKRLVFSALDRLWMMDLPSGTPRRLTKSADGEFQPAWSPDGKYIAYITWSDKTGGSVSRMRADGAGAPERLTPEKRVLSEGRVHAGRQTHRDDSRITAGASRGTAQPRRRARVDPVRRRRDDDDRIGQWRT